MGSNEGHEGQQHADQGHGERPAGALPPEDQELGGLGQSFLCTNPGDVFGQEMEIASEVTVGLDQILPSGSEKPGWRVGMIQNNSLSVLSSVYNYHRIF